MNRVCAISLIRRVSTSFQCLGPEQCLGIILESRPKPHALGGGGVYISCQSRDVFRVLLHGAFLARWLNKKVFIRLYNNQGLITGYLPYVEFVTYLLV